MYSTALAAVTILAPGIMSSAVMPRGPVQAPQAAGERVRWVESFLGHEVASFVRAHAGA